MGKSPIVFAAALLSLGFSIEGLAQAFPSKPIRNLIAVSGGGENTARMISDQAAIILGVPLLSESQSAAGGAVAVVNTVKATPDGYTILYATAQNIVLRPFLVKNNPYDPQRDLTPLAQVGETTYALAGSMLFPAATLGEVIEYAKRNPGKVSYASTGIGTTGHLAGVLIEQLANVQMLHVPYKGGTQSMPDLIGGRVYMSFTTMSSFTPMVDAGKIRIVAMGQEKRYERMPKVQTIAEVLPGFEIPPGWFGFFGPANMPPAIVKRLSDALMRGARMPEVVRKLDDVGITIVTKGPEQYAEFIRQNIALAARVMKTAGIQPE
ncbi:MAG: Bug family tripartite tricarboxylate transporter substrate binding protein [Burkholderiales bacterium]